MHHDAHHRRHGTPPRAPTTRTAHAQHHTSTIHEHRHHDTHHDTANNLRDTQADPHPSNMTHSSGSTTKRHERPATRCRRSTNRATGSPHGHNEFLNATRPSIPIATTQSVAERSRPTHSKSFTEPILKDTIESRATHPREHPKIRPQRYQVSSPTTFIVHRREPAPSILDDRTQREAEKEGMIHTNNRAFASPDVNDRIESDRVARISNKITQKNIHPPVRYPRRTMTSPAFKTTRRQNATSSGKESYNTYSQLSSRRL